MVDSESKNGAVSIGCPRQLAWDAKMLRVATIHVVWLDHADMRVNPSNFRLNAPRRRAPSSRFRWSKPEYLSKHPRQCSRTTVDDAYPLAPDRGRCSYFVVSRHKPERVLACCSGWRSDQALGSGLDTELHTTWEQTADGAPSDSRWRNWCPSV